MQKEAVCSKMEGSASVDSDVFDIDEFVDQEIKDGCPIENRINPPVTIRKLINSGFFIPGTKRCKVCFSLYGLDKCKKKYLELSLENKMRVDGLIEKTKIRIVDCPDQIPASS